jgi:hypothetical protein
VKLAAKWVGVVAFSSMLVVASCGGTAVVDGENPVGTGGGTTTTSTTGPTGTTGTGTNPTSTTTPPPPPSACGKACDILESCGHSQNCEGPCDSQDPACAALHQEYVECFADNAEFGICSLDSFECIDPLLEWAFDCGALEVVDIFCDQGGPDCFCYMETADPPIIFEQNCFQIGGGESLCDCYRNGEYTGACTTFGPEACDPFAGCCSALNFIDLP